MQIYFRSRALRQENAFFSFTKQRYTVTCLEIGSLGFRTAQPCITLAKNVNTRKSVTQRVPLPCYGISALLTKIPSFKLRKNFIVAVNHAQVALRKIWFILSCVRCARPKSFYQISSSFLNGNYNGSRDEKIGEFIVSSIYLLILLISMKDTKI